MKTRVDNLRVGQRVDLEGDRIADPGHASLHTGDDGPECHGTEHPEWAFEYERVAAIEVETPGCVRVDFESGFSCGFPPDHVVTVDDDR